jgi:hypothetical protein
MKFSEKLQIHPSKRKTKPARMEEKFLSHPSNRKSKLGRQEYQARR